ncbi:nitrogenase-stabilizing/protective protein NifW [Corallincola platygyrae]|uniref:Nitrogenase-stabilizing/protective protein NifW n=1 Tax=Corallincola platygyrae TaxID=1193278 RepID=A0ABW4XIN4_9GAMM
MSELALESGSASPCSLPASDLDLAMAELATAEDFLRFFEIPFKPDQIRHRRIALMRNFGQQVEGMDERKGWRGYRQALEAALNQLLNGESVPLAESKCGSCTACDDDVPAADTPLVETAHISSCIASERAPASMAKEADHVRRKV